MAEQPRLDERDVEFVFRGGSSDGIVITEIKGLIPSFKDYHGTGERDPQGRWILIWDHVAAPSTLRRKACP